MQGWNLVTYLLSGVIVDFFQVFEETSHLFCVIMSKTLPSTGAVSAIHSRDPRAYKRLPNQENSSKSSNDLIRSMNRVPSREVKTVPSLLLVHLAIITAQVSFGGGSVIGSLGMPETNPVLFALIREVLDASYFPHNFESTDFNKFLIVGTGYCWSLAVSHRIYH